MCEQVHSTSGKQEEKEANDNDKDSLFLRAIVVVVEFYHDSQKIN